MPDTVKSPAIPADFLAVKPAPDCAVRIPERAMRLMRAAGELVPATSFWRRRIASKDVIEMSDEDWGKAEADRAAAAKDAEAKAKDADKPAANKAAFTPA